jgi:ABC-type uncharacterized transport system permease subunit
MLYNILALITIALYLAAAVVQLLFLTARLSGKQILVLRLTIVAVIAHAGLLYHWIDTSSGQNLSFFNLFSQAAWLVAVIHLLLSMRQPLENLGIFIFPITALSIALAALSSRQNLVDTTASPLILGHLLLAILAFSVLCIAACQAVLLAIQDWQLRHKDTSHALRILPPVESMEKLLFQLIVFGFALLSLLLVSSFYCFEHIFQPPLLAKTLLTILAWFIFAILLGGRLLFGWRSNTAVRWTISGVVLVLICYSVSEALS